MRAVPRAARRGYALVEVLVAATVLAIGLLGGVALLLDGENALVTFPENGWATR